MDSKDVPVDEKVILREDSIELVETPGDNNVSKDLAPALLSESSKASVQSSVSKKSYAKRGLKTAASPFLEIFLASVVGFAISIGASIQNSNNLIFAGLILLLFVVFRLHQLLAKTTDNNYPIKPLKAVLLTALLFILPLFLVVGLAQVLPTAQLPASGFFEVSSFLRMCVGIPMWLGSVYWLFMLDEVLDTGRKTAAEGKLGRTIALWMWSTTLSGFTALWLQGPMAIMQGCLVVLFGLLLIDSFVLCGKSSQALKDRCVSLGKKRV